jgi:predicted amidophosphoribosyltransferase
MKEVSGEPLARQVGDALADWLQALPDFSPLHFDAVIPIPQHWFRRITHRHNQAEVLAERIAKAIDQPLRPTWLQRARWTQKQGLKTMSERRVNLAGAFRCPDRKALQGRRLLLVDDVMTSGATLEEAAQTLRLAGAQHIEALVFARGINAARGGGGSAGSQPPERSSGNFSRPVHP